MLLSNQQKYILEILKEFKYLRVRQLHALVQAHYRTQGIKIDERRMEMKSSLFIGLMMRLIFRMNPMSTNSHGCQMDM